MPIDTKTLTIAAARDALRKKEISALELTESVLATAKKENQTINAYAEIWDDARDSAKAADKLLADGKATDLTGIPLAIKDNMLVQGRISTSGSKVLSGHRATYDGTAVAKLRAAGAVFIGRANMDEFAMGSSSETCAWGPVKNPIDPTRVPGGSSGGSAAAVVMGGALGSLGSDTGGSIRQPAAHCGIVGLKPTYGAVSRHGLMALASSLDQIGPFARTVEDAEILFRAIEGADPMDATTVPRGSSARKDPANKEKLTIGVPESFIAMDGIDEDVRENFKKTLERLKSLGHTVQNVDLPTIAASLPVYYIIMPAEASANLARYDGIRYGYSAPGGDLLSGYMRSRGEGFGRETRRRVLLGTYVLSAGYYDAYYNKAVAVRRLITEEFVRAFGSVDVIATPTAPSPAFKLGEKTSDPLKMYLEDIFTVSGNIAGIPGISVPSGAVVREGKNLPVGIQFMGPHFGEDLLFGIGRDIERTDG